jgi:predicted nucleic acid-binding protein
VASNAVCFLDSNILLRVLTKDDPQKAAVAFSLLEAVDRGDQRLATSPAVIFEVAHTLRSFYGVSKSDVARLLAPILDMRGLQLPDRDILLQALQLSVDSNVSLVDAYNAEYMRRDGIGCIYSWDQDFDTFSWLKRVEPT